MTRRGSGSAAARAGRGARRALSRDILVTGDLCFQSSGWRMSSITGRSGVAAATFSPTTSASPLRHRRGIRSRSCRRSRSRSASTACSGSAAQRAAARFELSCRRVGVPRGCFGPKLEAAIASLTVRNRLSRRQLVELMEELFGCPLAVGTIDAILTRTAETLEPVYDELLERTRDATALNIDETGWYLSGEPRTLWGAFSKRTTVLRIAPERGKQHLHGLI